MINEKIEFIEAILGRKLWYHEIEMLKQFERLSHLSKEEYAFRLARGRSQHHKNYLLLVNELYNDYKHQLLNNK